MCKMEYKVIHETGHPGGWQHGYPAGWRSLAATPSAGCTRSGGMLSPSNFSTFLAVGTSFFMDSSSMAFCTKVESPSHSRLTMDLVMGPPRGVVSSGRWIAPELSGLGSATVALGAAGRCVALQIQNIIDFLELRVSPFEIKHFAYFMICVLKELQLLSDTIYDMYIVLCGCLSQAERCRLSVGHPDVLTSDPDIVAALSISGNFGFETCSHGDFLGAILGTGIVRDKLGDIILQGENGAQVLVVPELVDILVSSLDKVRNVSITCKKIPLLALEYQPPRTKSLKTVEASQRLDAIASAGFKISRSKMADLISNGDVRVNWCTVTKSNTTLKPGDLISVSGKGRLKVGEINSTRKGKFAVELIRFL
ncbi:hypothetical protein SASPL_137951 [Salvia splendens]|uniref:RNA-binding S4 domain-containing protein n=1 Tax=Salvia splendens TaxID=180675 RepID=A0A8X8WUB1_SALSN|nr:hypothetical protein SASPL_137951 [Salvia splendens]